MLLAWGVQFSGIKSTECCSAITAIYLQGFYHLPQLNFSPRTLTSDLCLIPAKHYSIFCLYEVSYSKRLFQGDKNTRVKYVCTKEISTHSNCIPEALLCPMS